MGHVYRQCTLIYPYGATLNVVKPAISILSSGSVAFPVNRPICAFCIKKEKGSSGISLMLHDGFAY